LNLCILYYTEFSQRPVPLPV